MYIVQAGGINMRAPAYIIEPWQTPEESAVCVREAPTRKAHKKKTVDTLNGLFEGKGDLGKVSLGVI
jgi:hypothetical protein